MPVFYPSARVKLAIRVDEGTSTDALRARLPAPEGDPARTTGSPAQTAQGGTSRERAQEELADVEATLAGVLAQRDDLAGMPLDDLLGQLRRRRDELQRELGADDERPEALSGASPDDRLVLGTILPQEVTIERNGLRTADKARVVIDHRDAPFDPRMIRACGIEIVLGVVTPEEYHAGARGQTRREDGTLLSLVPRGMVGAPAESGTTRFVGVVDEWTVQFDGDNGDTITLECRDLTAIPLDTPLPSGVRIDTSLPIDEGVRALFDSLPATRGTPVRYGLTGEEGQAPTPNASTPRARRGRRGGRSARGRAGGQQVNVWDHLTDVCVGLGLVPVFEDSELRLVNPRTFYEGRSVARRMVYGRNLKSLEFTRKLAGVKVPTVEVRCYDPAIGRTRWARYPVPGAAPRSGIFGVTAPPRAARANEVPPSGSNPDDRIMTQVVDGITDPEALARAAESIWHQVGRQEIEGNFATDEVSSWGEIAEAVDLLRLRTGDPVELLVASAETERLAQGATLASATELAGLQREARAQYLERVGWSRDVAERFAALQDAVAFQTVFRVQDVRISFSQDSGVEIAVDFINFLEVRELAQEQPTSAEASPQVDAATRGRRDAAAEGARTASATRRFLTTLRETGSITDEDYQRRMDEFTVVERRRLQEAEGA